MKATTIKLEGDLLLDVEKAKNPSQSVTAFVKDVLSRELRRRKLHEAAMEYEAFLQNDPEERKWLVEWEKAELATPPRARKR